MKLASKIITGLAVLGLAAPVLAAESTSAAPVAKTQTHRHARKVAQHTEKKGEAKKVEKKAPAKAEKAPAKAEKAPAKAEPAAPAK